MSWPSGIKSVRPMNIGPNGRTIQMTNSSVDGEGLMTIIAERKQKIIRKGKK
jgi:hypothetical protein